MNLYLSVFIDPSLNSPIKKIIRHESGEKATKVFIDLLLEAGYAAHEVQEIETTLLLNDGPIGIISHL